MLISIESSTSGYTYTDAKEVCLFALLSKGDILTNLWTPFSPFNHPKAKSPSIWIVAVFIPATSPGWLFSSLILKLFFSPHIKYILKSISAQSQDSVPPAPAVIWRIADIESSFLLSIILNSMSSIRLSNSLYDSLISFSLISLFKKNSLRTVISSYFVIKTSNSDIKDLICWISLTIFSASLGFVQKLGSEALISKLERMDSLDSRSKKPP